MKSISNLNTRNVLNRAHHIINGSHFITPSCKPAGDSHSHLICMCVCVCVCVELTCHTLVTVVTRKIKQNALQLGYTGLQMSYGFHMQKNV